MLCMAISARIVRAVPGPVKLERLLAQLEGVFVAVQGVIHVGQVGHGHERAAIVSTIFDFLIARTSR